MEITIKKLLFFCTFIFIICSVSAYNLQFDNSTLVRSIGLNSNITFSLPTTAEYFEVTSKYIYLLNTTTSSGFCAEVNLSTPNTTLDSKDFCATSPPPGGGGGVTPVLAIFPSDVSLLCNKSYSFINIHTTNGVLNYSNNDLGLLREDVYLSLGKYLTHAELVSFLTKINENCIKVLKEPETGYEKIIIALIIVFSFVFVIIFLFFYLRLKDKIMFTQALSNLRKKKQV